MAATRKLQGEKKMFPACLHLEFLLWLSADTRTWISFLPRVLQSPASLNVCILRSVASLFLTRVIYSCVKAFCIWQLVQVARVWWTAVFCLNFSYVSLMQVIFSCVYCIYSGLTLPLYVSITFKIVLHFIPMTHCTQ